MSSEFELNRSAISSSGKYSMVVENLESLCRHQAAKLVSQHLHFPICTFYRPLEGLNSIFNNIIGLHKACFLEEYSEHSTSFE
jgi:hypothetical protein